MGGHHKRRPPLRQARPPHLEQLWRTAFARGADPPYASAHARLHLGRRHNSTSDGKGVRQRRARLTIWGLSLLGAGARRLPWALAGGRYRDDTRWADASLCFKASPGLQRRGLREGRRALRSRPVTRATGIALGPIPALRSQRKDRPGSRCKCPGRSPGGLAVGLRPDRHQGGWRSPSTPIQGRRPRWSGASA